MPTYLRTLQLPQNTRMTIETFELSRMPRPNYKSTLSTPYDRAKNYSSWTLIIVRRSVTHGCEFLKRTVPAILDTKPLTSGTLPPAECARPGLHEFLTAIYPYYDICMWCGVSLMSRLLGLITLPHSQVSDELGLAGNQISRIGDAGSLDGPQL
jgi:hypothetical protein